MYYFYFTVFVLLAVLVLTTTQIFKLNKQKAAQKKAVKEFQNTHEFSDSELRLFKTEMGSAKEQLLAIEKQIRLNPELAQNQELQQTIAGAKLIFAHLMEQPRDLIHYDKFLNISLPSLRTLLEKYATQKEQIADTLAAICQAIDVDFQKLKTDNQEEIEQLMELIK